MGYRSFSLWFASSVILSGWMVSFLWGGGELVLLEEGGHLCNSEVPSPFCPAPFNLSWRSRAPGPGRPGWGQAKVITVWPPACLSSSLFFPVFARSDPWFLAQPGRQWHNLAFGIPKRGPTIPRNLRNPDMLPQCLKFTPSSQRWLEQFLAKEEGGKVGDGGGCGVRWLGQLHSCFPWI